MFFNLIFKWLLLIIFLFLSIALLTVLERQTMGIIQRRQGPTHIGFIGLLQAFADGLKLFLKEHIYPKQSNFILFLLAPIITFSLSIFYWLVLPTSYINYFITFNYTLLYLIMISTLNIYGIILGGWASNSKYALLGCLRSTAQMVSYEINFSFLFLCLCLTSNSLNINDLVFIQKYNNYIFLHCPTFILIFITLLAETNRHPFDLPEAESELVSGYNVEYSSIVFAFFFLGEYLNIIVSAIFLVLCFFGGWENPIFFLVNLNLIFLIKILIIFFIIIIIRAILPRYRYDQLMLLNWKFYLPIILSWFLFLIILYYRIMPVIITNNFFIN